MAETTYRIEGMTCGHCVMHVAKALKALPGVSDAAVDLSKSSARVTHDGTLTDGAVLKAIEEAGYKASRT